jgi:patatin-like phospholipase/acyl hydrolase
LAFGVEPSEILSLYKVRGSEIFRKPHKFVLLLQRLRKAIHKSDVLKSFLVETLGEQKLGDAKTRLCIPAYDLSTATVKVYKTDHHPSLFKDYQLAAWEVVLGSCSAPFYFESAVLRNKSNLIDGGIWGNNPSLVGLCESINLLRKRPAEVFILSIGSGQGVLNEVNVRPLSLGFARFSEMRKLIERVFQAQSQAVENIVKYLGPGAYKRINPILPSDFPLDNVAGIPLLEKLAEQKAQETIAEVKEKFFKETCEPYVAEHKKKGAGE